MERDRAADDAGTDHDRVEVLHAPTSPFTGWTRVAARTPASQARHSQTAALANSATRKRGTRTQRHSHTAASTQPCVVSMPRQRMELATPRLASAELGYAVVMPGGKPSD